MCCCPALVDQLGVPIKVGLGIYKLGLIAMARGDELIELRLVGAGIDLREQVTLMHRLTLREVDADDLSLDLATNDNSVVGNDRADPIQIDGDIMLGDRARHDGYRRHGYG